MNLQTVPSSLWRMPATDFAGCQWNPPERNKSACRLERLHCKHSITAPLSLCFFHYMIRYIYASSIKTSLIVFRENLIPDIAIDNIIIHKLFIGRREGHTPPVAEYSELRQILQKVTYGTFGFRSSSNLNLLIYDTCC